MAFQCTVPPDGSFPFTIFTRSQEIAGTATVGVDEEIGAAYSTFVSFAPQPGGVHELIFCLVEADEDNEYKYWNGRDTTAIIPDDKDREIIVDVAGALISEMLARFRPDVIYHNVVAENLAEKALLKHLYINSIFEHNGYTVIEGETRYGRRQWILEQVTGA